MGGELDSKGGRGGGVGAAGGRFGRKAGLILREKAVAGATDGRGCCDRRDLSAEDAVVAGANAQADFLPRDGVDFFEAFDAQIFVETVVDAE